MDSKQSPTSLGQTDRVLYNKWYIDHNFQITKNYKQQVIN